MTLDDLIPPARIQEIADSAWEFSTGQPFRNVVAYVIRAASVHIACAAFEMAANAVTKDNKSNAYRHSNVIRKLKEGLK